MIERIFTSAFLLLVCLYGSTAALLPDVMCCVLDYLLVITLLILLAECLSAYQL